MPELRRLVPAYGYCVDAMVIGFESPEQIDQMMDRVETVLKA